MRKSHLVLTSLQFKEAFWQAIWSIIEIIQLSKSLLKSNQTKLRCYRFIDYCERNTTIIPAGKTAATDPPLPHAKAFCFQSLYKYFTPNSPMNRYFFVMNSDAVYSRLSSLKVPTRSRVKSTEWFMLIFEKYVQLRCWRCAKKIGTFYCSIAR